MKFIKFIRLDVRENNLNNNLNAPDIKILKSDLRGGRSIGAAVLGERYFFVPPLLLRRGGQGVRFISIFIRDFVRIIKIIIRIIK